MSAPKATDNDTNGGLQLLQRIRAERDDIDRCLKSTTKRRSRLVQAASVAGSVAPTLTAAPALSGQSLSDWLSDVFATPAPAWQILCGIAALCALAATVATQLQKSRIHDERIVRAQGARANLEVLEVGIAADHLNVDKAFSRYQQSVRNGVVHRRPIAEPLRSA